MSKSCQYEEKARKPELQDETFKLHLADCAECRETRKVSVWMQKFAAQTTTPKNLRSPGFLMLKARVIEKQTAANRAVQPFFLMQIAAVVMFILGVVWLEIKSDTPIFAVLSETLSVLLPLAPLFLLGVVVASIVCFAFAYTMRRMKL